MAGAYLVGACTPGPTPSAPASPTAPASADATPAPSPSPASRTGGTLHVLTQAEQWNHVDPQRLYTLEDLAFFGATIYRSLESYSYSPDPDVGASLTPDLATDLGRPSDGGRTWSFTLRDGVSFQTGEPITCEDIRYGVSRTFANVVISEGPTYAIHYLDIPAATDADTEAGYLSSYHGPYDSTPAQQALFDEAVECSTDHRTITFHLQRPVADFNYTTTLGFFPVPRAADTGETYGTAPDRFPVSSGPYMVESYTTGEDGRFVLVRNPSWDPSSDPIRKAYPDRWEVDFALEPDEIARRLIAAEGDDAFAISYAEFASESVEAVFGDDGAPTPAFATRAVADFGPYSRYLWINVQRVKDLKVRQAMLVALDRDAMREVRGGAFYGEFADGAVAPSIGRDYAPTGIWDTYFGQPVPDRGDPVLARKLLDDAGGLPPTLSLDIADTPVNQEIAAIVIESLGRAGLTVEVAPQCIGYGCGVIFDPGRAADFGLGGWGADWPNASTVIPPLFTEAGGWDLSQVDDPAVNAAVEDAFQTLDRAEQARKWQALNRQAVEDAWIIPTFFAWQRRIAGTNVGPIYQWPAYSSWPYGEMSVTP